jgi:hypothetical protein
VCIGEQTVSKLLLCPLLQACVEEQSEQAAAAAAAARQLSVLLRVERSQRRQLEERLTAATGHVRAARQGLLLEQQHVQELEVSWCCNC